MRLVLRTDFKHWQILMQTLSLPENRDTYERLIAAYGETHRAYHTLAHIDACLRHLDKVQAIANSPAEIELAFWFHDAVYKPFSKTNEDDSADWAEAFLLENGVPESRADTVHHLIMLTKDHQAPQTPDGELMLDIDLSILGAPDDVYDQFEKDVRFEYRRVPSFLYRKKRKEILAGFLVRDRLYHTDYFHDQRDAQARRNLARAIGAL